MKGNRIEISAWINGATGEVRRRHGVTSVQRTGPGQYTLMFPPDKLVRMRDFHIGVSVLSGEEPRYAMLGNPGGDSLDVRIFDFCGDPADADFLISAERI
jgi:hypothetical protein